MWALAGNSGESEMDFAVEVKFRSRFRRLQGQIDHKDKCSTSSSIIRSTDKEKNADENGVGHHRSLCLFLIHCHPTLLHLQAPTIQMGFTSCSFSRDVAAQVQTLRYPFKEPLLIASNLSSGSIPERL
jgi:hypothetical protein